MHCAGCVANVENSTRKLSGVEDINVNLAMKSATIDYHEEQISLDQLIKSIEQLGYQAKEGLPNLLDENKKELASSLRNFKIALYLSLPLMIFAMYPMFSSSQVFSPLIDGIVQALLAGLVLFVSGKSILSDAFRQLKKLKSNMNSLIALGTLTAYGWSLFALYKIFTGNQEVLYFESSAMIITLILLGKYFEAKTKRKASDAIEALMNLTPPKALAIINNVELEIDSSGIQTGMILLVRPGERVPADGEIIEGTPSLDESMLTGESIPVDKAVGDKVTGGSLNSDRPFKLKVTAAGADSYLSSVIKIVAEAQMKKAPAQNLADKIASIFVPSVITIALITLGLWLWLAPDSPMLIKSVISVLIIACPCALGLATPTAVLVASGKAAREGILYRGGDIIEKVNDIDMIVFDKTGTLTFGELEVAEVITFGSVSRRNFIRMIGSAETYSEHPVAKAIVHYMKKEQIDSTVVKNVEAFPGTGLKAEIDSRILLIGNRSLMEQEKISFGQAFLSGEQEMKKGRTTIYAALDNQVIGLISLADRVRSEAKDVISSLKKRVKNITMLTGDARQTASGVAHSLGIDEFEAEIKPHQKKIIIDSLRRAGRNVAMVGDGINDAPSLAAAQIGIAMGTGTDIAIDTADIILNKSDLNGLLKMFDLSQLTLKTIKQNLFWAFFYNVISIPIAAGLFYPMFGITLSPMIAAAAMSVSSIFVVSNSLKINRS